MGLVHLSEDKGIDLQRWTIIIEWRVVSMTISRIVRFMDKKMLQICSTQFPHDAEWAPILYTDNSDTHIQNKVFIYHWN